MLYTVPKSKPLVVLSASKQTDVSWLAGNVQVIRATELFFIIKFFSRLPFFLNLRLFEVVHDTDIRHKIKTETNNPVRKRNHIATLYASCGSLTVAIVIKRLNS